MPRSNTLFLYYWCGYACGYILSDWWQSSNAVSRRGREHINYLHRYLKSVTVQNSNPRLLHCLLACCGDGSKRLLLWEMTEFKRCVRSWHRTLTIYTRTREPHVRSKQVFYCFTTMQWNGFYDICNHVNKNCYIVRKCNSHSFCDLDMFLMEWWKNFFKSIIWIECWVTE